MNSTLNTIFTILSICIFTISQAQSDVATKESIYKDFKTEHLLDAKVTIGNAVNVGDSKYGNRNIIPITGGTFEGSKISGEVLPYGADWQLVRPDGDVEFNARYLLKTSDGFTIQVINKVLLHRDTSNQKPEMYTKSVVDFEASNDSPYAYLNHAIFLGTLTIPELKPGETPYVIIGVYKLL